MKGTASWASTGALGLLVLCVAAQASGQVSQLTDGTLSGNNYHHPELGFRYEFPKGWAVNEPARIIKLEHQFVWEEDKPGKGDSKAAAQCSKTLLFVSEHPDGMQTNEYDPMASLTAVDSECIPGTTFPVSVNDRGQIQSVADQVIIHLKPPTLLNRTPAQIRAFNNGGRVMLEISRSLTLDTRSPQRRNLQNIKSSMLVMEAKQYWIIWTFASADDRNLDKMRASKIYFDTVESPATPK
jgi:hypothetical protein